MKVWQVKGDGNTKQEIAKYNSGNYEYRCIMRVNEEFTATVFPVERTLAEAKIKSWYADSALTVKVD